MASIVQETTATENTTASPFNRTITATGTGNLLLAFVGVRSSDTVNTTSGVSDGTHGNWTRAVQFAGGTALRNSEIWFVLSSTAGVTTVTFTPTVSATYGTLVAEIAPTASFAWSALDQTNTFENIGVQTHSHGSITTTARGVIVTCATESAGTANTVNANFVAFAAATPPARQWYQHWLTATTQTTNGAFTTAANTNTSCVIANFTETAAGGGTTIAPSVGAALLTGTSGPLKFGVLLPDEP